MSAGNSMAAQMVRNAGTSLPTSFDNDGQLFGLNLFLMTAFMCLGLMMAGRLARAIWINRYQDLPRHPVTIWRLAWLSASIAASLRCGTEAMNLWAWSPIDATTTARVLMAKRWIDPAALLFATGWMVLVILANSAMEEQLRTPVHQARTDALWRKVGAIGKSIGFHWGGEFHSILDRPHFEWSGH